MNAAQNYETSVARVEEIIRRLDAGAASLSETLQLVREGKDLIEHCARELDAVGDALEELRLDELVARLEGQDAAERGAAERGAAERGAAERGAAERGTAERGAAEPGAAGGAAAGDRNPPSGGANGERAR